MCRALLVGIALTALVGIPVAESQQCDVSLADADEFEERAMADDIVWVLVFTSKKDEGLALLIKTINAVSVKLEGKMKVGCIDIKSAGAKELGSEYNVRKHNVPQCRVLVSRARAASKVALNDDDGNLLGADAIAEGCMSTVSENKVLESGGIEKVTLALGGGGGEDL